MKIMTYNIASGGIDSNGSRVEQIIKVINDENPDFLAIQEADNFEKDDFALLKRISTETNLPYFELSHGQEYEDGVSYHVVSLCKTPIKNPDVFIDAPFSHAGLATTIDSPVGEITLCNIHLHTRCEDHRLKAMNTVLEYLSKFEKCIILGDYNALSRTDQYDDLTTNEFTHYDLHRFEATDLFNEHFVDTARFLQKNSMRTHPTIGMGHPISKTPVRIDYIFVTDPLVSNLKDTRVIKTSTTEIASDHYPVELTLTY